MQDMKETKTKKMDKRYQSHNPASSCIKTREPSFTYTRNMMCDLKFKKVQCNSNHDTIMVWLFIMTGKIFHEDY